MALDPSVADQLTTLVLTGAKHASELNQLADRNLAQGMGVINSTLIQQHGGAADDAATMAALRTAVNVPARNNGTA